MRNVSNIIYQSNMSQNNNTNVINGNNEKKVEIKNEVKNYERIIEDDTFSNITFLKDFNNINIKKYNVRNSLNNNNYYSYLLHSPFFHFHNYFYYL